MKRLAYLRRGSALRAHMFFRHRDPSALLGTHDSALWTQHEKMHWSGCDHDHDAKPFDDAFSLRRLNIAYVASLQIDERAKNRKITDITGA